MSCTGCEERRKAINELLEAVKAGDRRVYLDKVKAIFSIRVRPSSPDE